LSEVIRIDPQARRAEETEIQGERVPKLGFGTWRLRGEACYQAVLSALELGYRHIDTAEMYENHKQVGQAMRDSGVAREEVFLTTKVWKTNLRPADVIQSCQQSLEQLQVEAVDLLLIHWPNPDIPLAETLSALNDLKSEGKTCHIGVSNFPLDLLQEAQALSQAPIFCDQVAYHIYEDRRTLVRYCQEQDILLTAYSPLAKGKVLASQEITVIAGRHGKDPAQIALRWLIQQENVAAIPKAARKGHRIANLDLFDFHLSEDEMARIFRLAE
jgi:diketogulonate reductase-like aldo/keto reductase